MRWKDRENMIERSNHRVHHALITRRLAAVAEIKCKQPTLLSNPAASRANTGDCTGRTLRSKFRPPTRNLDVETGQR